MKGQGTSGTATGLQFSCEFPISFVSLADRSEIPGCPCRLHLYMYYSNTATPNYFEHACLCLAGNDGAVYCIQCMWERLLIDTRCISVYSVRVLDDDTIFCGTGFQHILNPHEDSVVMAENVFRRSDW